MERGDAYRAKEESKEMPTPRPGGGATCTNRRHRSSAHVAPVTARQARKTRAAQREQEENGTHQQETVVLGPPGTADANPARAPIKAKLAQRGAKLSRPDQLGESCSSP